MGATNSCNQPAEEGVHQSVLGNVEIPNTTLPAEILAACDRHGERIAMVESVSGKEWTFAKLAADTRALAGGLVAAGMKPEEIVGVFLPNRPEYFCVMHGVMLSKGTVTTLNPTYSSQELEHVLALTRPKFMFTIDALVPAVSAAASAANLSLELVLLEETRDSVKNATTYKLYAELLLPGSPFEEATDPNAIAVLPYSSGTTGLPKAVMLTHRNIVSQLYQLASHDALLKFTEEDVIIAVLPFFHIYGLVVLMEIAVWKGAKVVTLPKFLPDVFLKMLKEQEVTFAPVAPPLVNFLAKHPSVDAVLPLPKLRELFSGAAPLGEELAQEAKTRLGVKVVRQGYGMTEMSPASHIGPLSNPKGGSIGILVPGMEMKLVSTADGHLCTSAQDEGEIWLRGPNVMKGYYKNEEATKECLDADGFLHTGDVGQLDADGQIWIVDRIKELIKVKGFQVAPAELEATLVKHQGISDAAVIGVAAGGVYGGKQGDGQVPKAFVVKKDAALTEAAVKEFVSTEVQSVYKQLAAVEFVDAIPKSASGKILRKELRKKEEAAGVKIFA